MAGAGAKRKIPTNQTVIVVLAPTRLSLFGPMLNMTRFGTTEISGSTCDGRKKTRIAGS
jgi:hypothetical protein